MFEYPILLGVLSNSPKDLSEVAVSQTADAVARSPKFSEAVDPNASQHSHPIANVSPAELLPAPLEWQPSGNQPIQPPVTPKPPINESTGEPPVTTKLQPDEIEEKLAPPETEREKLSDSSLPRVHPDITTPEFDLDREALKTEEIAQTEEILNEEVEDIPTIDLTETADPELGTLQIQERTLTEEQDSELGNLRIREQEIAEEREPDSVFLIGRFDYFRSDNIFLDDFAPIDDQLVRGGLTLLAVPELGPQTQLVTSISGNIARYGDLTESNYNDIEFRAGIRQFFTPRTYGELSWRNQQFFDANDGDRFLNDHSLRLSVGHREYLTPRLTLDGFYQFRLSFADPDDRSRISNTVGLFLNYNLQQNLDVGLDYQVVFTDFTHEDQNEDYHQVTAQISYDLNRNSQISLYGGFSFGRSSDPFIDFDSSVFGVVFDVYVPLF